MEYVKLYGELLTHPKWHAVSHRARAVLVQSWAYAGLHETNGHLPDVARRIVELTPSVERELEEAGWLHRNGAGWVLHDWTDHQVDAEEYRAWKERVRGQDRERKRRQREREHERREEPK